MTHIHAWLNHHSLLYLNISLSLFKSFPFYVILVTMSLKYSQSNSFTDNNGMKNTFSYLTNNQQQQRSASIYFSSFLIHPIHSYKLICAAKHGIKNGLIHIKCIKTHQSQGSRPPRLESSINQQRKTVAWQTLTMTCTHTDGGLSCHLLYQAGRAGGGGGLVSLLLSTPPFYMKMSEAQSREHCSIHSGHS